MSPPHVIRLRSAWTQQITPDALSFTRGFNSPTGLDGTQQVWIVIDDLPNSGTVYLNDQPLGRLLPKQPNQFEITAILASRNQVRLELCNLGVESPPAEPTAVRLEIRQEK